MSTATTYQTHQSHVKMQDRAARAIAAAVARLASTEHSSQGPKPLVGVREFRKLKKQLKAQGHRGRTAHEVHSSCDGDTKSRWTVTDQELRNFVKTIYPDRLQAHPGTAEHDRLYGDGRSIAYRLVESTTRHGQSYANAYKADKKATVASAVKHGPPATLFPDLKLGNSTITEKGSAQSFEAGRLLARALTQLTGTSDIHVSFRGVPARHAHTHAAMSEGYKAVTGQDLTPHVSSVRPRMIELTQLFNEIMSPDDDDPTVIRSSCDPGTLSIGQGSLLLGTGPLSHVEPFDVTERIQAQRSMTARLGKILAEDFYLRRDPADTDENVPTICIHSVSSSEYIHEAMETTYRNPQSKKKTNIKIGNGETWMQIAPVQAEADSVTIQNQGKSMFDLLYVQPPTDDMQDESIDWTAPDLDIESLAEKVEHAGPVDWRRLVEQARINDALDKNWELYVEEFARMSKAQELELQIKSGILEKDFSWWWITERAKKDVIKANSADGSKPID